MENIFSENFIILIMLYINYLSFSQKLTSIYLPIYIFRIYSILIKCELKYLRMENIFMIYFIVFFMLYIYFLSVFYI